MRCKACGQERFTAEGVCVDCDPDLHGAHDAAAEAVRTMTERFQVETGQSALGRWAEYERFVARQPDAGMYARALGLVALESRP